MTAPVMQRRVVIVGTWHHFQEGRLLGRAQDFNAAPVREFEAFLRSVIRTHGIVGIAEEMGDDRLDDLGGTTLVGEIARSLSLPYRNCDLTQEQRVRAGFNSSPPDGSDEELRLWEAREAAWRDCLLDLDRWPALFVCGGKHPHRFAELLSRADIEAQVEVERWEPAPPTESN